MREPLIIRRTGSTKTTTPTNIESIQVPAGQLWLIRGVALDNESGEQITVAFGIENGSDFTRISALATVANGDAFSGTAYMLLREGEKLAAQVTGTADSGLVKMSASGWIFDCDEEE